MIEHFTIHIKRGLPYFGPGFMINRAIPLNLCFSLCYLIVFVYNPLLSLMNVTSLIVLTYLCRHYILTPFL